MRTLEPAKPLARADTGVGAVQPADRIRGVDAARALAIVGMVMVHVGPTGTSGLAGTAYGLTHGRASILFVLLAGVGVSLLAGDGSARRVTGTRLRLLWRALLLFPLGLWLQTLDTNVAVILQYYAVYFLVAVLALRLPDRWLVGLAGGLALAGPLAMVLSLRWAPSWYDIGGAATVSEPIPLAGALLLTGYYPLVTWTPPLLVGIWIGRRDLRDPATQRGLFIAGAMVAAVAYSASWALGDIFGLPGEAREFLYLTTADSHSDMPLAIIGSGGVAAAVLGGALLVGWHWPRLIWPVAAMGQLALTIYVGHLLVLHFWPDTLVRADVAGATFTVARLTVITLVAATLWRALLPRGPLEALFHAPWTLARLLRGNPGETEAAGGNAGGRSRVALTQNRAPSALAGEREEQAMQIGIIGSGHIGGTLAGLFVAAGHEVMVANSRGPETLHSLVEELGDQARAGTAREAAAFGDVVVVSVPFGRYRDVPAEPLAGKIVIDTNNYYPGRDGRYEELDEDRTTSTELLAEHAPGSRVVKAFNTIYWEHLRDQGGPAYGERRAIPIAGDDEGAKQVVAGLIGELGFEVVDTGSLGEGGRSQQPGSPIYGVPLTGNQLRSRLKL